MSENLIYVSISVLALVLNFAIKAFLYRIKKGRFKLVEGKGKGASNGFISDYGDFILSPSKGTLSYSGAAGPNLQFAISDIKAVKVKIVQESSLLGEFVFGFDLWDIFAAYRDSVDWRVVLLEVSDGVQLPAYIAGQYVRREVFLGWWFEWEKEILQRLGLFKAVEDLSWEVSRDIEQLLRSYGGLEKPHSPRFRQSLTRSGFQPVELRQVGNLRIYWC